MEKNQLPAGYDRLTGLTDKQTGSASFWYNETLNYVPFSSLIAQTAHTYYTGAAVDNAFSHTQRYTYARPEQSRSVPLRAVVAQTGSGSEYLFTGQERDEETGLLSLREHNYRARMMSGTDELGRFFAMDPQAQFHSPYVYAANNLVSLMDTDWEYVS